MRPIILSLLICLISSNIYCQVAKDKITYGIRAGANVSDLITDRSGLNVRATYNIGAILEYEINERFSLQPEFIYSRQGEVDRGVDQGIRFDNDLYLDYFSIPLMGKYYLTQGFAVESGLQFAYLIRAERDDRIGSERTVQSVKSNYRNADALLNLGLNYRTDWGFFIGLRYSHGLINVLKNPTEQTNSQKNAVYQFNFGFYF